MNYTILWSIGLLLVMTGSDLLATRAKRAEAAKQQKSVAKKNAMVQAKSGRPQLQRVMPVQKVIGSENRQALIDNRRAQVKAMMKTQAKIGQGLARQPVAKKGPHKKSQFRHINRSLRPRVHKRYNVKAKSIAKELSTPPKYARFIPDPEFGHPHRVSLVAAKKKGAIVAATQAKPLSPPVRSARPHKNAMLKQAGAHKGMS